MSLKRRLDVVTRREQSLNLFHALGKVFYNKREKTFLFPRVLLTDHFAGLGDPGIDDEDQEELANIRGLPPEDPLPPHLKNYERRRSMTSLDVSVQYGVCAPCPSVFQSHFYPPSQLIHPLLPFGSINLSLLSVPISSRSQALWTVFAVLISCAPMMTLCVLAQFPSRTDHT